MFVYDSFETLHTHKAQIERLRALTSFAFGLVKQGPIFMKWFFFGFFERRCPRTMKNKRMPYFTPASLHGKRMM